jgi:sigma-E factor negative regulatory protein RseB
VVVVEPRDDLRYGYRVWIDDASAMPLKTQLRTSGGRVVEQLVFTELSLPAHIADTALQPAVVARQYRWMRREAVNDDMAGQPAEASWDATGLPPGFRLTGSSMQTVGNNRRTVTHLVFSDGLASVSVFVEPKPQPSAAGQPAVTATTMTRLGSSSALSTEVDGHKVTAIGEVPPETVRAITRSLRVGFAPATAGVPGLLP